MFLSIIRETAFRFLFLLRILPAGMPYGKGNGPGVEGGHSTKTGIGLRENAAGAPGISNLTILS
jgi:hypothetical protein